MKCDYCGFENKDNVSFCQKCGVNLKQDDSKAFKDNVEVLNNDFKLKKRQPYPTPPEDSIKARLLYKHDRHTGQLRLAKTKCITLIVYCGFAGFGFLVSLLTYNIIFSIIVALIFGAIFAVPVAIIGYVIGIIVDRLFH